MAISRNPAIAYQQGVALGRQLGLEDMFLTHCYVLLPAMYNAMPERTMSGERFAEYAKNTELEIARILDEVFGGDIVGVKAIATANEETLSDKAKYLVKQVNDMRKRCGMEIIGGKNE